MCTSGQLVGCRFVDQPHVDANSTLQVKESSNTAQFDIVLQDAPVVHECDEAPAGQAELKNLSHGMRVIIGSSLMLWSLIGAFVVSMLY